MSDHYGSPELLFQMPDLLHLAWPRSLPAVLCWWWVRWKNHFPILWTICSEGRLRWKPIISVQIATTFCFTFLGYFSVSNAVRFILKTDSPKPTLSGLGAIRANASSWLSEVTTSSTLCTAPIAVHFSTTRKSLSDRRLKCTQASYAQNVSTILVRRSTVLPLEAVSKTFIFLAVIVF